MARLTYNVDYHIICTLYLSNSAPSGADLARLWCALEPLAQYAIEASIAYSGDKSPTELTDLKLGSPMLYEMLGARADQVVFMASSSVRVDAGNAVLDSDVNFNFKQRGIWDGRQGPGILSLSLSGQVLEELGQNAMIGILREYIELADASAPICGLVDLARPSDAFAGMVYSYAWPRTAPLARWVEQTNWMYSGANKSDCLRGLYWGNYLGAKIIDRLGGRNRFAEAFVKQASNYDGSPNAHCWHLPNGLFVSLCLDPFDCRPTRPIGIHVAAEANMKWLARELGTKGVLNPW